MENPRLKTLLKQLALLFPHLKLWKILNEDFLRRLFFNMINIDNPTVNGFGSVFSQVWFHYYSHGKTGLKDFVEMFGRVGSQVLFHVNHMENSH